MESPPIELFASSSSFFTNLIIGEAADTPPPDRPFLQVRLAPLMPRGSGDKASQYTADAQWLRQSRC